MKIYNSRAEVEEKYKWDLSEYYKDEADFQKHFDEAKCQIKSLEAYEGCTKDKKKLFEYLTLFNKTYALVEDLYVYAYVLNDQLLGVGENIERINKVSLLDTKFMNATNFFAPEILKLTKDEYQSLFKDYDELNNYKAYLDKIYREKDYVLEKTQEDLIVELVNALNNFQNMSEVMIQQEHDYGTINIDGKSQIITTNNSSMFLKNQDSAIRREVYQKLYQKLDQYGESSASFLDGYVKTNQTTAKLHHYKDAWDKKLFDLNLNNKVFTTLVKTAEENVDKLQKYYNLKSKIQSIRITSADLLLPIVKNDKKYSIEEAQQLVRNSLIPLGDEYLEKYDKIIKNRYIDYCQYKGKCNGGYNISSNDKNSLILMNYKEDLVSVSTIAHECGHHVHTQFVHENNPLQYSGIYTLVSEVTSLTNECLLSHYLVKNAKSKNEKLAALENLCNVFCSNFYGAIREGKMEQDMYEEISKGNTITKDFMDNLTLTSLKKYYGNSIEVSNLAKSSWILRSHYYMNFYLYSYSICISIAMAVATKIINGDKDQLNKYYQFLKLGTDIWPVDAFKVLGINLEDKKVYEDAIISFNSLVERLEKIYFSKEV